MNSPSGQCTLQHMCVFTLQFLKNYYTDYKNISYCVSLLLFKYNNVSKIIYLCVQIKFETHNYRRSYSLIMHAHRGSEISRREFFLNAL
jgi:hypothetical protein